MLIVKELTDKANIPALRKFKHYMEQRGNKRIPMIIREILVERSE
jgi:hypothetical protein